MPKKKRRSRSSDPPDWDAILNRIGPCPPYVGIFTVEDGADVARRRVEWQRKLADEIARHRKRSRRDGEPAEVQEHHSPTVPIAVDDTDGNRKARRNMTRVRQAEAWRHNRLTGMQRDAEREMEFAWRHRTMGLGAAVSHYGEPGGRALALDWAEMGAQMEAAWQRWCDQTRRRKIRRPAVIDCLTEPKTLAQVERDYRLDRGEAFQNYVAGLDLWCEIRGWTQEKRPAPGRPLVAAG